MIVHRYVKNINKNNKGKEKIIFEYKDSRGIIINDKATLAKILAVRVPPAYTNVEIDLDPNTAIFAKGKDVAGRKQYIYNPKYVEKQNIKKYCNLIKFGKKLPLIKKSIDKMIKNGKGKDKMIGLVLRIIMQCNFRIGNEIYKKKYNSYGITTLQSNHIKIKSNEKAHIKFIGKKGVVNECMFKNKEVVNELRELIDKSTKGTIFKYKEGKDIKNICAIEVNNFLRSFGPFTSKSFRTWEANNVMLKKLMGINVEKSITKRKKIVSELIKDVAIELHHTPAICRRSYLVPGVLDLYIDHPTKFAELKNKFKNGMEIGEVLTTYLKDIC